MVEVYFKQNNKNIIFTTIFATFYFEIAVKWLKSRIFEKFQLDHAKKLKFIFYIFNSFVHVCQESIQNLIGGQDFFSEM